jgi:hypothetical protein
VPGVARTSVQFLLHPSFSVANLSFIRFLLCSLVTFFLPPPLPPPYTMHTAIYTVLIVLALAILGLVGNKTEIILPLSSANRSTLAICSPFPLSLFFIHRF